MNDRLALLIADRMAESTTENYISTWREACGGPSSDPPLPIKATSVPVEHLVFGRGREYPPTHAHGWTTTRDELGTWWSYRQTIHFHQCLGDTFDMWKGHGTRGAAKNRARGNAKVQRMHLKETH